MTDAHDLPDLTVLYEAALPDGQPGAWTRKAIRAMVDRGEAVLATDPR